MDTAAAPVHLKEMEKGRAAATLVHPKDGQTDEFRRPTNSGERTSDLGTLKRGKGAGGDGVARRWTADDGGRERQLEQLLWPTGDGVRAQFFAAARARAAPVARQARGGGGSRRPRRWAGRRGGGERRQQLWGTTEAAAAAVGNGGGWVFLTLDRSRRERKWVGADPFPRVS